MKIVVGYDDSDHAKRALGRAAELAGAGGTVLVVSAVPLLAGGPRTAGTLDTAELEERKHVLAEAVGQLEAKGVDAHMVEAVGDPADAIVTQAEEMGADLVVVGTRGRNIVGRLLLGSVSTKVVQHAPCDVLVVR